MLHLRNKEERVWKKWLELKGVPFRWGGFFKRYEQTSKEWAEESDLYKKCYCCKGQPPLDEPLYCATFEIMKGKYKGNNVFRILCRNCAYSYGKGVVESDGETYLRYEDYLSKKGKENEDRN